MLAILKDKKNNTSQATLDNYLTSDLQNKIPKGPISF